MKKKINSKFLVLSVSCFLAACNFSGGNNSVSPEDSSSNIPDSSVTSSETSSQDKASSNNSETSSSESKSSAESSNSHTHTWDSNWSSDETYHWHKCTGTISDGNTGGWGWGGGWGGTPCQEVKDKAAHTFDEGKITTPASAYGEGVKTFTCTVCKKTKTESIPATGPGEEKVGNFSFGSDITVAQEIHTQDQKNFLNFTGEYYNITSSQLNSYNATGTQEKSFPNQVKVTWNYEAPAGKTVSSYSFVTGQKADLSDGYLMSAGTNKQISFYNPFLGDNYFKVIANLNDGTTEASEIKIFKVAETAPRNLKIGNMSNCRDMGGRTTVAGGKVRQGLIYRTSDPSGNVTSEVTEMMINRFKVKSEIYVKDGGTNGPSPLGNSVAYYNASMDYGATPYSNMSRNAERLRKVFSVLAKESNYPTFYHCRIGTDRTGICAVAINGLLGVPFNEIIQDYSFSNFGKIDGQRYAHKTPDNNGDDIAKYIDEILAMPGKNFQEQMYNSLRSIGIPQADLIKVIDILTEGPKATLPTDGVVGNVDAMTLTGTSKKTASDFTKPDAYAEISSGKSVSYKVNIENACEADIVAYLGATDSSDSTKLASGIELKIDGNTQTIVDKTYFKAGFGTTQQARRTGFMFNKLGKYSLSKGEHTITISGKSSTVFSIGTIGVFGGATGGSTGGESGGSQGGQTGGNETSNCEHTFGSATTVAASGEGVAYETKDCSKCSSQRVSVNALSGTVSGTNKSGTPTGYLKLSNKGEKVTVKINYPAQKSGKIYLEGIMDSYPNNASKTFYSANSGATNGNFTLKVNGNAVDYSSKKNVTFGEMLGSEQDPNRTGYSKEGLCEVGEVTLNAGLNTIEFSRVDSYNLLLRNFVLIVK